MKKIIVIGCPGSGKSTFARKLRDKTGLPLHYLDMLWHLPDKTNITEEAFDTALAEILAGDAWIIDGNYSRTLAPRIAACDTILLFDLETEICLAGAMSRLGHEREDIPWPIETALDPEFADYIRTFRAEKLPMLYEKVNAARDHARVVIFRSRAEAGAFLERL